MIHVTYSNETEALLGALCEHLAAEPPGRAIFQPTRLVVPNRSVETYVRFGLARELGIAANLEVAFLRRFIDDTLAASRPDVKLVDGHALHGLVLDALHSDAVLATPELTPVREWLDAAQGSRDARDLRRCQLAETLARLFDEYALSRPDWLHAWQDGRPLHKALGEPFARVERWQRALWRAIFGPHGLAEARGPRPFVPLHVLAGGLDDASPPHRAPVHVFGFSYVAPLVQSILSSLGRSGEVHVYLLNPCREYWEDVASGRRGRADDGAEDGIVQESDALALRLWGRPGRESTRVFNRLAQFGHDERFRSPVPSLHGNATLLRALQEDILSRTPAARPLLGAEAVGSDESLTFLAAQGMRREMESIAAEIWRLVREDDKRARAAAERLETPPSPLRFNDIAVVLPAERLEAYLPHLCAFREAHELPFSVVDLPLTSESRVAEAVERILALPLGRFGREEMLRVLTHPAVMSRFPGAGATDWIRWCESLGIVHGADHTEQAGTYVERDLQNWDQGLLRLALGATMAGARSGNVTSCDLAGESYLPEEVAPDHLGSAAAFALLARSLIADARFLRDAKMPLSAWVVHLRALVRTYVVAQTPVDEGVLQRCLGELEGLSALEVRERALSFRTVAELARERLARLRSSRGQHLADGVVVSSFVPMRAIPFRVVFVAGLGEGDFPASDRQGPLDLRGGEPRSGDVSPRDRDRYLFLETLLCARERLYLSWVARDEVTGEARAPSTVVSELRDILAGAYLAPEHLPLLERRGALWRDEDPAARAAFPQARAEAEAAELGACLAGAVGEAALLRGAVGVWPKLSAPTRATLERKLGLLFPPPEGDRATDPGSAPRSTVILTLQALRRFLECPLQGYAAFRLGLREDDEGDLAAREEETFAASRSLRVTARRAAFLLATEAEGLLAGEEALARAWDELALRLELRGELPTGVFAATERAGHLRALGRWREACAALGLDSAEKPRVFRFGRAGEHAAARALREPVVIDVDLGDAAARGARALRVEIHGETQPLLLGAAPASLVLIERAPKKDDAMREDKDVLRTFLEHVLRAAAGEPESLCGHSALIINSAHKSARVGFRGVDADTARSYLAMLARELLDRSHDYLLPCEAVLKAVREAKPVTREVDALREAPRASYSSLYGPVRDVTRFDAPSEAEAQIMVERRFGLFRSLRERPEPDRRRGAR